MAAGLRLPRLSHLHLFKHIFCNNFKQAVEKEHMYSWIAPNAYIHDAINVFQQLQLYV